MIGASNANTAQRLDVNQNGIIDQNDYTIVKNINLGTASSTNVSYSNPKKLPEKEDRTYYIYNAKSGALEDEYTLYASDIDDIISNSSISQYSLVDGAENRTPEDGLNGVLQTSDAGTIFVIDDHTILTAAHCLFNKTSTNALNAKPNLEFRYYSDHDTVDTSVNITPIEYHIPEKYTEDRNANYDYALITVKEDLSEYINFNVGVLRDEVLSKNPNLKIYVTGFGSSKTADINLKRSTGVGTLTSVADYRIMYNTDTSDGNSGSPIYIDTNGTKTVIGIHTSAGNSGIRFTTDILNFIYNHK